MQEQDKGLERFAAQSLSKPSASRIARLTTGVGRTLATRLLEQEEFFCALTPGEACGDEDGDQNTNADLA